MLTVPDIITFERVGIRTIGQLVKWQIAQFIDYERWLRRPEDWDTLMLRFSERMSALEREQARKRA